MAVTNNSINNESAPFTVTANDLTVTNLTGTNGGVVVSGTTGIISHIENSTTDGQVLISAAAGTNPVWASITAGAGISVTPSTNSITIASTASTVWTVVSTNQTLAPDVGLIFMSLSDVVDATLPTSCAVGEVFELTSADPYAVTIVQNAGQYINFGNLTTTVGVTGYIATTSQGDTLKMVCIEEDLGFQVISSIGNLVVA